MYRTKSFNELLSKELQDPVIGREYIVSAMEGDDGLTLVEALFEVISIMGTKEYSELVGMKQQNVSRLISSGTIPKLETVNQLLAPFKLKARLDVEEVA